MLAATCLLLQVHHYSADCYGRNEEENPLRYAPFSSSLITLTEDLVKGSCVISLWCLLSKLLVDHDIPCSFEIGLQRITMLQDTSLLYHIPRSLRDLIDAEMMSLQGSLDERRGTR